MQKVDLYKRLKIAGMVSFIPLTLAAGPVAGYFAGEFLQGRLGFGRYALYFCIAAGFAAAVFESVRIIRLVLKIERT